MPAEPFLKKHSCALYMRLSKEDGELYESASIENQRKILRSYVKDHGFIVFDEYIDDGFTGTNFERPAFQRMKADIASGQIGVVITKDFSRLGRNTGQVMTMLDDFFLRHGVRYISITEGIDTKSSDITGLLAPMLSFTNELYSGDISRKINASLVAKMRAGEFIGAFAPYGYQKDPKNKNHLLPDRETATVVKRIFSLAQEGHSPRQIAQKLNCDGVLTPSLYRAQKTAYLEKQTPNKTWTAGTVSKLLRNEVYLGHTLQGKTHKPSFKSDYIETVPKSRWIVARNTHQALVDQTTWDIVRKRMQSRTKVRTMGFTNLFSGIAKCADCGRNMSTVGTNKKGALHNLTCGGYKQFGKMACTSHLIDYHALYQIVLMTLRSQIHLTPEEQNLWLLEMLSEQKMDKTTLTEAKNKLFLVSGKLTKAYDKKFADEIDDETFETLRTKYTQEKEKLTLFIKEEERRDRAKTDTQQQTKRREELKKLLSSFSHLEKLDSHTVFRLIERIDVHQGTYAGGVKRQQIDIYFKFQNEQENKQIVL